MPADPEIFRFLTALTWSPLAVALYYLLIRNEKNRTVFGIMRQRLLGVLFFGFVTVFIIGLIFRYSPADFGAGFIFDRPPPWWIYPFLLLIPVSAYFAASSQSNLSVYPQIRIRTWTAGILILNTISWILYLIAYEFLFRGFLLTASLAVMTTWQAITLNCLLYALAHLYKGRLETLGAIPVGILLCYLTLLTGNIWCAVVIHSVMALSNDWFSLRAHPEMHFKTRKTIA